MAEAEIENTQVKTDAQEPNGIPETVVVTTEPVNLRRLRPVVKFVPKPALHVPKLYDPDIGSSNLSLSMHLHVHNENGVLVDIRQDNYIIHGGNRKEQLADALSDITAIFTSGLNSGRAEFQQFIDLRNPKGDKKLMSQHSHAYTD